MGTLLVLNLVTTALCICSFSTTDSHDHESLTHYVNYEVKQWHAYCQLKKMGTTFSVTMEPIASSCTCMSSFLHLCNSYVMHLESLQEVVYCSSSCMSFFFHIYVLHLDIFTRQLPVLFYTYITHLEGNCLFFLLHVLFAVLYVTNQDVFRSQLPLPALPCPLFCTYICHAVVFFLLIERPSVVMHNFLPSSICYFH